MVFVKIDGARKSVNKATDKTSKETDKESLGKVGWVYELSKFSLVPYSSLTSYHILKYGRWTYCVKSIFPFYKVRMMSSRLNPHISLANLEKLPAELLRLANKSKKKDSVETNKTDPSTDAN